MISAIPGGPRLTWSLAATPSFLARGWMLLNPGAGGLDLRPCLVRSQLLSSWGHTTSLKETSACPHAGTLTLPLRGPDDTSSPHSPAQFLCCTSICLSSLNSPEPSVDASSGFSGSCMSRSGCSPHGSPSSESWKPCSSTWPIRGSGVSRLSEPSSLVCTSILITIPS